MALGERACKRISKQLGQRIAERRTEIGLSRSDLAAELGVERRQLWRMENAKIRILAGDIPAIVKALRTDIASLFGRCE